MNTSRRMMTRRSALGLLGAAGASTTLAGCGGLSLGASSTGDLLRSQAPLPAPFEVALPIPPVKEPTHTDATTDYYDIVQLPSTADILPGRQTPIYGYDGIFPGPTIVSRSGRRAVVRHRNELSVPIAVHLHGGHTPAEHDGYPIDLVFPVGLAPHEFANPGHGRSTRSGEQAQHEMVLGDVSEGEREYIWAS